MGRRILIVGGVAGEQLRRHTLEDCRRMLKSLFWSEVRMFPSPTAASLIILGVKFLKKKIYWFKLPKDCGRDSISMFE